MIELRCKNCGADMSVNLNDVHVTCPYCKMHYLLDELITETKLNNMDKITRIEPLALNAYNLYEYGSALQLYSQLIRYDPSEMNIARYNICRMAVEDLRPTFEVYASLNCLTDEERYTHLNKIRQMACKVLRGRLKYVWQSYIGWSKFRGIINSLFWYKSYKWLDLMIQPVECLCGHQLKRGMSHCNKCERTRIEIVEVNEANKRHVRYALFLIVAVILVFYVKGLN